MGCAARAELAATGPRGRRRRHAPASTALTALPPLVAPPLSRDAVAFSLPLASGQRYRVEQATISAIGATGTWDAGNGWTLALETRDGEDGGRYLSGSAAHPQKSLVLRLGWPPHGQPPGGECLNVH